VEWLVGREVVSLAEDAGVLGDAAVAVSSLVTQVVSGFLPGAPEEGSPLPTGGGGGGGARIEGLKPRRQWRVDYGWRPADDVEAEILTALRDGDSRRYARLLRSATLYQPADLAPDSPWPPSLPLPEGNYVIVFTSAAGLDWTLGGLVETHTETTVASLAETRAPDTQLVVNPGLPIGVFLSLGEVDDVAEGRQS
jgi:hypothetical protein